MKEGWEYKKLGEVCGKCSNIKWDDVSNEASYRYIDLTSVDRGDLHIHNPQNIRKDNAPSRAKQIIKAGDVIFATTRPTLRRVSIIEEQYDGDICSTGFCVLRHNEVVKSRFVFYALLYDGFYKYIEPLQTGANYPAVTDNVVKNYIIPVPPLPEQQRIVDYLDSAFAKIDTMKANAEKALNEAKVLFQASLKEMLEPKEGWEEKVFGDLVVSNIVGLTRGKVEQGYEKKYPYLKMNNISPNNTLCWDDLICVDANEEELEKYCLQEGDFLFNTRNSKEWVGKSTVYRDYDAPVMLYNNNVMRIRFVDTINPVFVAYSFLADYTKDQLEKIKSGTTNVWAIYYRDLSKILLTYPLLSEQQSIVETLDSLKSKVDRLQENYDKISQECDALKQSILRQVFE